jgi:hypothetical protein
MNKNDKIISISLDWTVYYPVPYKGMAVPCSKCDLFEYCILEMGGNRMKHICTNAVSDFVYFKKAGRK